ncbi:MAG TPA: adenosylcobinamide-GDP ribazoletransferase [Syntrophaceae bacterium]|nr:adenosylcobinamide-GDP ribazoletransferase [Syntrophaceae bacterium]
MRRFLIALQFLTIFTLKKDLKVTNEDLAASTTHFPLVGLTLGVTLVIAQWLFSSILPQGVVNGLLMVLLIICTGALHLDGFADTLDGIAGGMNRKSTLKIMRDSQIGPFGVVGLITLLLTKYLALNELTESLRNRSLLLMPSLSRWTMAEMAYFSEYARKSEGVGQPFVELIRKKEVLISGTIILIISSVLMAYKGILILAVIALWTFIASKYFNHKLGGVTGDVLGAINEFNEVLILLLILVLWR